MTNSSHFSVICEISKVSMWLVINSSGLLVPLQTPLVLLCDWLAEDKCYYWYLVTWKNSESSKKILEPLEIYGKSVQTSINWFSSSLFMADSGDVLGKLIPSAPEKKWGIPQQAIARRGQSWRGNGLVCCLVKKGLGNLLKRVGFRTTSTKGSYIILPHQHGAEPTRKLGQNPPRLV